MYSHAIEDYRETTVVSGSIIRDSDVLVSELDCFAKDNNVELTDFLMAAAPRISGSEAQQLAGRLMALFERN